jgi:transcriptional regulator with XRE-family HTH domain
MQSHASHGPPESIGPMLARLRLRRGHSQLRLAEQLCAAAGVPTVSRHEVSRWEREERVPGPFWIGWLAAVLEVPVDELAAARPARRPSDRDRAAVGSRDRADAGGRPARARASG